MMADNSRKDAHININLKEKGFKLPLPTIVKATDSLGNEFSERTVLSYISHHGASLWLTHNLAIGSPIKLIIDLPQNLSDQDDLQLIIKGKTIFIESGDTQRSKQRVSVKFENRYIIQGGK